MVLRKQAEFKSRQVDVNLSLLLLIHRKICYSYPNIFLKFPTENSDKSDKEVDKKAAAMKRKAATNEASEEKNRRKKSETVDAEIEIPATQSPPKCLPTKFPNKSLSRIKDEDRGNRSVSMLSSPSIMMSTSKPKPPAAASSLTENFIAEIKLKVQESNAKLPEAFDIDAVFDQLKKSDEDAKEKNETTNSTSIEEISPEEPKKALNLPPIKKFQPKPEWSEIDAASLSHLKESSVNFRHILEELKKAK